MRAAVAQVRLTTQFTISLDAGHVARDVCCTSVLSSTNGYVSENWPTEPIAQVNGMLNLFAKSGLFLTMSNFWKSSFMNVLLPA